MPRERIVRCPRSENFWQAGPRVPAGPCSELYLDRGVEYGSHDDLPGGENERFLEYWNLVFMQYDQQPRARRPGSMLKPLPANNIDTGLGPEPHGRDPAGQAVGVRDRPVHAADRARRAALRARATAPTSTSDRALRILADHARAMTFLIADGVVPSNEDRGYVLRRVMRRAIQQGLALELAPGFLVRYAERVRELMGGAYPELREQAEVIDMWLAAEEESFGRTLDQGMEMLQRADRAGALGRALSVAAADVFRLHDTYGFPYEMTSELLADGGPVDRGRLRGADGRAARARSGAARGRAARARARPRRRSDRSTAAPPTSFTGYETEEQPHHRASPCEPLGDGRRDARRRRRAPARAAREARGVALLRRRRRPGLRRRHDRMRGRRLPRARSRTCSRSARTGSLRWSSSRERCDGASPCWRAWTAAPGTRRSATTPPRICCRRRCASVSAVTCARPARTWAPTSFASTSATGRRSPPRSCATSRTASTNGSPATTRCARSPPRSTRPSGSARWRCSARSTATSCAWSRSARASTRASCAAAPTSA